VRHVEDYYLHMLFRDFSDFVKMWTLFIIETIYWLLNL
jgi:hypothetical protein